jgi:AraC-like DNA-binding protein
MPHAISCPTRMPLLRRHRIGGYTAYEPTRELSGAVEGFWTYLTPPEFVRPEGATHRVLPDPSISLAFCCRRDTGGAPEDARVLLIGEKTRPKVFAYDRRRQIAAVRIKVEAVERLLGLRPGEHQDADVELGTVLPLLAEELLEAFCETRTPRDAIEILRTLVMARPDDRSDVRQAVVRHALDAVRDTHGRSPVERIADTAGFSVRHLRRLVHDATGVSLKHFARTTRFVTAITAADAAERPHWAQVAADAGFYDQSHLVRDCQDICGLTPTELHRERRAQVVTAADAKLPAA